MNEKIKELAKNVDAVFDVLAMGRHDGVLFTETELERFSELIIQECIEQCYAGYDSKEDWDKGVRWEVIKQIKEHFEIK